MINKKPSFIKDKIPKTIDDGTVSDVIDNEFPEYTSYEEWNKLGYCIIKGKKANIKENGVPLFHQDQVEMKYGGVDELDFFDTY